MSGITPYDKFISGSSTPFGIYDADTSFQNDANKLVPWVLQKLGDPTMTVELSSSHVFQSFEEAAMEYSAIVNSYQAKSVMSSLLGSPTGTLSGKQNKYPHKTLEFQRRQMHAYADEAGTGGVYTWQTASIGLVVGQQTYDLQALINPTGSDGLPRRMIVKDIFHFSPLNAFRFFGTTSAINYLANQFSFESFTPETIFYLLPVWEDILRGMQFKTSNKVRRSNYSFELHNNVLSLYPLPSDAINLWFTYRLEADPFNPGMTDVSLDGVSNLSNVPFGNISYSLINSMGKQWIWKMTHSLSKEILGRIRAKMSSIPIPEGDLQLDGPDLISDAKQEQEQLRSDLKQMLDDLTYDKVAEREAQQAEALERQMMRVPLKIYIG